MTFSKTHMIFLLSSRAWRPVRPISSLRPRESEIISLSADNQMMTEASQANLTFAFLYRVVFASFQC